MRAAVAGSALLLALATSVDAQRAPAAAGAELRPGLVLADDADIGVGLMLEGDAGYLLRPPLRVVLGLGRFVANVDREPGGDEGSYAATGLWAGLRYDLLPLGRLSPYARASLTLQRVDSDAFDRGVDALLEGTYVGAGLAVGLRRALDAANRLGATLELRRTFANNIAHTALELGARYQPRGRSSYAPTARAAGAPARGTPAGVAGAPPNATPVAASSPLDSTIQRLRAQAERDAAEAARLRALARDVAERPARRAPEAAAGEPPDAADARATEAMLRLGVQRAAGAMGSATGVQETEEAFVLTISGGAFPSGAASLTGAARAEVRVLAAVLAGYPGYPVRVEGHADAQGDAASNRVLSEERAAAVRAALIAEGVDPLWVSACGLGSARPVASNATAAGRAANRRVEIRIARRPAADPPAGGCG